MLIRIEASNFRSIDEAAELSMVAVDRDRDEARDEPHLGESLLTRAAIYGPNASGKSNLVSVISWLREAVVNSLRFWEEGIPLEQFAFSGNGPRTTEIVYESTVDGIRFEYVLELDKEKVHYEGLFHYPEKKRRRIFEREGLELKLQRGLGSIAGTREMLTDRTLVLSAARRFGEPLISRFVRGIMQIQTFGNPTQRPRQGSSRYTSWLESKWRSQPTVRWFEDPDANRSELFSESHHVYDREQALAMLRLADLGIEDVLVEDQDVIFPESGEVRKQRKLSLLHRVGDQTSPLDFWSESEGTKTWFHLIGPVLTALRDGGIVVFDELDASLHPTVSAELLKIFGSPSLNRKGAQLIFTSHDTSLLNSLNRDEVWLTEKRRDGSTRVGALAEFAGERVRRSQNLENAYLHGRFGALPQVDQADLLRALGLVG